MHVILSRTGQGSCEGFGNLWQFKNQSISTFVLIRKLGDVYGNVEIQSQLQSCRCSYRGRAKSSLTVLDCNRGNVGPGQRGAGGGLSDAVQRRVD